MYHRMRKEKHPFVCFSCILGHYSTKCGILVIMPRSSNSDFHPIETTQIHVPVLIERPKLYLLEVFTLAFSMMLKKYRLCKSLSKEHVDP
jgi:hypothetical protein